MTNRYRYYEWDGTQDIPPLEPDDLLAGLTDDLMNFGDLDHALRNLLQRGFRDPAGQRREGLRDLLQQIRQKRRETLERYNLSSAFEDIQKRLQEVLSMERETLDRRQHEADQTLTGGKHPLQPFEEAVKPSSQQQTAEEQRSLSEMLKKITEKNKSFLDSLPEDVGGQVKDLQNYEFMDPEAAAKFQELMEMLKKAMMDTFFKDMYQQITDMSPEDLARMKEMIRDVNQMLSEKMAGGEPDFQGFMEKYGEMFGPNPPQNLEELVGQMQQGIAAMHGLLDSLPSEMRRQLQDLLMDKIGDPELQRELHELAINLDIVAPASDRQSQYPFRGEEELDLLQAMHLMDNLQGLDELGKQLERSQYGGDLDEVDEEKLRQVLGDEAAETMKKLKDFLEILEEAGYIRRKDKSWELTPKGVRKIGEKALGEIYTQLKKSAHGNHPLWERGAGGERADETKAYEFGDPFHLNLGETIMNAIVREGPRVPVHLEHDDFQVYRAESLTTTATVLMLDLSWSMALRGN
ncbi:MAG: VWA domain-containing protein, partial [Dehalococcoidia bacterium]